MLAESTESLNTEKVLLRAVRNTVYFVPSLLHHGGMVEKKNDHQ